MTAAADGRRVRARRLLGSLGRGRSRRQDENLQAALMRSHSPDPALAAYGRASAAWQRDQMAWLRDRLDEFGEELG